MFPGLCWDTPTSCHPGCVLMCLDDDDDDDDVQCECFSFCVWQMTGPLHSTCSGFPAFSAVQYAKAKCKPSFLTQDTHTQMCTHAKVQSDYFNLFPLNVG